MLPKERFMAESGSIANLGYGRQTASQTGIYICWVFIVVARVRIMFLVPVIKEREILAQ